MSVGIFNASLYDRNGRRLICNLIGLKLSFDMLRKLKPIMFIFVFSQTVLAALPVELATDQQKLLESKDPILAANKKLVFEFWTKVFDTRDMSKAADYMREDYIQHNPIVDTGRAPFTSIFGSMPKMPEQKTIKNLVSIVAERDLVVLAQSRSKNIDSG